MILQIIYFIKAIWYICFGRGYILKNDRKVKITERMVIIVRKFAFFALLISLFAFTAAPAFADAASKEGWPEQLKFSAGLNSAP